MYLDWASPVQEVAPTPFSATSQKDRESQMNSAIEMGFRNTCTREHVSTGARSNSWI